MHRRTVLLAAAVGLLACSSREGRSSRDEATAPALERPSQAARRHRDFPSYFHRNLAELNRYALSQSRYGETHEGEAVLVFVTEDFHKDSQVKYEGGDREGVIEVLKMIAYRSFFTGIYPYTVSTAVYDPVDPRTPSPMKAVGSVTEWGGSTFMQWNRDTVGFRVVAHSYFEGEADRRVELPDVLLEDSLFTQIRTDPSALPTGMRSVVPGLHHLRFEHLPLHAYAARLERDRASHPAAGGGEVERYTIRYPEIGRTLRIYFGAAFPHEIFGWEEELAAGDEVQLTEASRTHALLDDFWNHNGRAHAPYRAALGLFGGAGSGLGISSRDAARGRRRGVP